MNDVPERQSYRLAYITLTLLAVILVILAVVVVVSYSGTSASQDVRESSRRADCRSAYGADLAQVKNVRDDLKLDLDAQYYRATFESAVSGARPSASAITEFGSTLDKLDAARAAVRALPRIDDAVDHGYTLNGVHHPPCPG